MNHIIMVEYNIEESLIRAESKNTKYMLKILIFIDWEQLIERAKKIMGMKHSILEKIELFGFLNLVLILLQIAILGEEVEVHIVLQEVEAMVCDFEEMGICFIDQKSI